MNLKWEKNRSSWPSEKSSENQAHWRKTVGEKKISKIVAEKGIEKPFT